MSVYYYETVPDAQEQIDALPSVALPYYAELITFMELTPWNGPSANKRIPRHQCGACRSGRAAKGWQRT